MLTVADGFASVLSGSPAVSFSIWATRLTGIPVFHTLKVKVPPTICDQKTRNHLLVFAAISPTFNQTVLSANVGYSSINVASLADRSSPAITGNQARFFGVPADTISFVSSCFVMSSRGSVVGVYGPCIIGYCTKVFLPSIVWLPTVLTIWVRSGISVFISSTISEMCSISFATRLILTISPTSKSSGLSVYVFVPALSSCTQKSAHLVTVKMFHTLLVQSAISLLVTTETVEITDTFSKVI